MAIRLGIYGFGRIGWLAFRVSSSSLDFEIVRINDPAADAHTLAHLLSFDAVHGQWDQEVVGEGEQLIVNGKSTLCTRNTALSETDWSDCDVVIEASGTLRTTDKLHGYLDQGVKRVVITAPVKEDSVLNVVMGVNHDAYDPAIHRIVTAASCTTSSLAPVVKVMHEHIGIEQGSITTIHNLTNTQTILDAPQKDMRRAHACGMSLIPTTRGSATAITQIFPELTGRLNGHAIRVPLANASLTDFVFDASRPISVEEVNELLKLAAIRVDLLEYWYATLVGLRGSMLLMVVVLGIIWLVSLFTLGRDLGRAKRKVPFKAIFSKSRTINTHSATRLFLFGVRDVWFVVALPVYLSVTLDWDNWSVGGLLALWVICYGFVQALAPRLTGNSETKQPRGRTAFVCAALLAVIPAGIALALMGKYHIEASLVIGLLVFGAVFAINSSLHSFLILSHASRDGVSLDVEFYYMANALGWLLGAVLSGWLFQRYGLAMCLWVSALLVALSALIIIRLPSGVQWSAT